MKTRQGFVSNSSSTSFCIVGTSDSWVINQLSLAMGIYIPDCEEDEISKGTRPNDHPFTECNAEYGVHESKPFNLYGGYDQPYY